MLNNLKSDLKMAPTPGPQVFHEDEVLKCATSGSLLRISVEVTGRCNLNCIYCYSSPNRSIALPLSFSEIIKIAHEAYQLGARTFVIIGGEPLLYPLLEDLIITVKSIGFSISLFSNLLTLTTNMARFLFENNVFVTGKLNSLESSTQDRFTMLEGSHQAFLESIMLLRKEGFCEKTGFRMAVHSIITQENMMEMPSMFRWLRSQGIIPHLQLLTRVGKGKNSLTPLSPTQVRDLFYALLTIDENEFGYTWTPTPPLVGWTCQQYYCSIYVTNEGNVKPCSSSALVLGSFRKQSLTEIIKQPNVAQLRTPRVFIDGPCQNCKHHLLCYGCRGDAEGVTNDIYAADQYCWRR